MAHLSHERSAALRARGRRARRTRAKVRGTATRPRLSVHRSLRHIGAQLIDDAASRTLLAVTDRMLSSQPANPTERARAVGKLLGQRARAQGLSTVLFDRGAARYHGRVRALAEGAREAGLTL